MWVLAERIPSLAHEDGSAALFYPDRFPIQIVAEEPSADGLSSILTKAFQKLNRYLSLFYTPLRKIKLLSITFLDLLLSLPLLNHRVDDWAKYEYPPKAEFSGSQMGRL